VNWEATALTTAGEWITDPDQRNGHPIAAPPGEASGPGVTLDQALAALHHPFLLTPSAGTTGHHVHLVDAAAGWPALAPGGALVPACWLEHLGDPAFRADHGLRYAYLAGSMANGIGSVAIVTALAHAGMLGFFGAAGLSLPAVTQAVDRLQAELGGRPFGCNLIHSPTEPCVEAAVADLYLHKRVHLVEASAFLDLTLPLVRYRVQGIHQDAAGRIVTPNRVIAKVSRVEVAAKFLAPPPEALLRQLATRGEISEEQARLARRVPVAQDLTAEADSAGHTDNRPLVTLLPTLMALRDRLQAEHRYSVPPRIGAAGGIATPAAAAAAFSMGAAYVLTGTVNQACVESGSSDAVRQMLAEAEQADTAMAPAADMFELGVKLQVLKRGTLFAMRAAKLYELYRAHVGLDEIPTDQRAALEKTIFRLPLDEVWRQTCDYFRRRDPSQLERASRDSKHKMALVFRWYLGQSSRWANAGDPARRIDYQVWCGPAMGAFNEWTRGSFLQQPRQRRVVTVALNILYGAAVLLRAQCLRQQGIALPSDTPRLVPLELGELQERLR
jgi:PfaD family protein